MDKCQPNLDVLFDMLNHNDPNFSYFAASRLPLIAKLLEACQEREVLATLTDKLAEIKSSDKLDTESNQFLDYCIAKYGRK